MISTAQNEGRPLKLSHTSHLWKFKKKKKKKNNVQKKEEFSSSN